MEGSQAPACCGSLNSGQPHIPAGWQHCATVGNTHRQHVCAAGTALTILQQPDRGSLIPLLTDLVPRGHLGGHRPRDEEEPDVHGEILQTVQITRMMSRRHFGGPAHASSKM